MKLLFIDQHTGCNFSTTSKYYLCENEAEYEAQKEKIRNWKAGWGSSWVGIDTKITCTPHTTVSDGFAVHGGHELKAKGCYTAHSNDGIYSSRTEYEYYIMPNSIEQNETAKVEQWWV